LKQPLALRLGLSACLVLVPLMIGAAPANAVTSNTAPECQDISFQAQQILANGTGNQDPSSTNVADSCTDPDVGDTLTAIAVTDGANGSAVIMSADPDMGYDTDYVQYTPAGDFYGRDQLTATVSDGTTTTPVTIYVHVVRPQDSVDCQATYNNTYKQSDEATDYYLNCFSYLAAPDDAITYTIDSVTPSNETANVVQHTVVDPNDGSSYPVLTFSSAIAASAVTVQVTATDGSGAGDTVFVVLDNQHVPVCTAPENPYGYLTLQQRSNDHTALTQDLGCTDPDTTSLIYTAPEFYAPNTGDPAPGTMTISNAGVATFTPTDPNWTGSAYYTGGVVDDGTSYTGFGFFVERYQLADLSASFTVTPGSVAIGSSYTATMHVANVGPDAVSGAYFDIGLPTGSVIGALPSACGSAMNQYLTCEYATIPAGQSFDVAIPVTAGPGSVAGVNHIGTQFAGSNLHNTNPALGVAFADVTLGSSAVVVPANQFIKGSAAADNIVTGAGNDCVEGGGGSDIVHLGAGDDLGYGDAGPCVAGRMTASNARFAAILAGNDRLFGEAGNDRLFGGPGKDLLVGGPGHDRFVGGGGNDVIKARDHVRRERIGCGAGRDVVYADKGDVVARNCERVHRR
jgi:hypothetical protein